VRDLVVRPSATPQHQARPEQGEEGRRRCPAPRQVRYLCLLLLLALAHSPCVLLVWTRLVMGREGVTIGLLRARRPILTGTCRPGAPPIRFRRRVRRPAASLVLRFVLSGCLAWPGLLSPLFYPIRSLAANWLRAKWGVHSN
jgi:hypothetical protein